MADKWIELERRTNRTEKEGRECSTCGEQRIDSLFLHRHVCPDDPEHRSNYPVERLQEHLGVPSLVDELRPLCKLPRSREFITATLEPLQSLTAEELQELVKDLELAQATVTVSRHLHVNRVAVLGQLVGAVYSIKTIPERVRGIPPS